MPSRSAKNSPASSAPAADNRPAPRSASGRSAPPKLRHEIDRLGGNKLRCQRQIAFVLTVLVVDHDQHPAGLELFQRGRNINKRQFRSHISIWAHIQIILAFPTPEGHYLFVLR